jgi:uncharacterized membrane protein YcaP (DUF421 family)
MGMDWDGIFGFTMSPWELILRGTLMYWFLLLLFRFLVRRRMGAIGLGDMLVLVLLADAAQNAMSGDYKTFSEGAVLVSTIIGWNVVVDALTFRVDFLRKILEPSPLPLVLNGKVQRKNMREEFLSMEELQSKLREKGVEDIGSVRAAYLESDGEFSVLQYEKEERKGAAQQDAKSGNAAVKP